MHTINSVLYKYISSLILCFGLLVCFVGTAWAQAAEGWQLVNSTGGGGDEGGWQLAGGTGGGDEGGWQRLGNGHGAFALDGMIAKSDQAAILGNYPNPFNPETTIRFEVRAAQPIRLSVFNVLGQRVQVLVDGWMESGEHEARFDGYGLPSGTYFTRLETTAGVVTHIIMLAK